MNVYEGIKCPGVFDSFCIPKLGAAFYMAQVNPETHVVLEPSFYWDAALHAKSGSAIIFPIAMNSASFWKLLSVE